MAQQRLSPASSTSGSPSHAPRSLVCDACWLGPLARESWQKLMKGEYITYETTWSHVEAAASTGCGLCAVLLFDKEEHKDQVTFTLSIGIFTATSGPHLVTPHRVQFLITEVEGSDLGVTEYFLYTTTSDPAAPDIRARDPVREVNSSRAYDLAAECLRECLEKHTGCPKPCASPRLPTRVLDCVDPEHPKLYVTGGAQATYAALSYVWGGEQPNSTVKSNLAAYTAEIPLHLIPQTIRDAITAASKNGFRYLWVDAYCIVQDSDEDKKRELTQLRRIFRDSYVTIIASSAPSAYAGFLQDRPQPSATPPKLPFWGSDGTLGTVSMSPKFRPYDGSGEPVNQRAWCLEERLLSARKLVYASDTLQYHCQSSILYIGDAIALPRDAERLPDVMFLPDTDLAAHAAEMKSWQWREIRMTWAGVLLNYTRRIVTKPRDKLTALGGVAEQFQHIWNVHGTATAGPCRYLAGLWEMFLPQDLLWRTGRGSLRSRPALYLAPSWSWASVDGEVSLYRATDQRLDPAFAKDPHQVLSCEIISCDVVLDDARLPHGRVTAGWLKLHAIVIPVVFDRNLGSEPTLFFRTSGTTPDLLVADAALEGETLQQVAEVYVDALETINNQMHAIPILWNTGTLLEDTHAAGILVEEIGSGKFKRVGFWEAPEVLDTQSDPDRRHILAWFISHVTRDVEII